MPYDNENFISILSEIDRVHYQITAISLSTSEAVNKEVKTIASGQSDDVSKMRGKYIKLTAKDRAAKNGIAAAIRQNNVQMHKMTCGTWPTVVSTFFTSTA